LEEADLAEPFGYTQGRRSGCGAGRFLVGNDLPTLLFFIFFGRHGGLGDIKPQLTPHASGGFVQSSLLVKAKLYLVEVFLSLIAWTSLHLRPVLISEFFTPAYPG
jgi:hypothetical protein